MDNNTITCPKCGTQYQARTYKTCQADGSLSNQVTIDASCPVCIQRRNEAGTNAKPERKPLGD